MIRIVNQENIIGIILAIFSLVIYLWSSCPSVDFMDAGELSTVAFTSGIAHPSGYPLFSIIGWIFTHVPLPVRIIVRANIMAGFFCAAGIYLFFRLLNIILNDTSFSTERSKKRDPGKQNNPPDFNVLVGSTCGALVLGFSGTYWEQATSVEVYSLHMFFIMLLLYLFFRAISNDAHGRTDERIWCLFAYSLGLAFCNHLTVILVAPSMIFAYFYTRKFKINSVKLLFRAVPFFILGLTLYVYLPVRALSHPFMNWGDPSNYDRFLSHISGKQYHALMYASIQSAEHQLEYFFTSLPHAFVYFPLVFVIPGIGGLGRKGAMLTVSVLLLLVTCLLYSVNYAIPDISSYFLPAHIAITILIAAGILQIISVLHVSRKFILIGMVILCLIPLIGNYPRESKSDFYFVEEYVNNCFDSVEKDGIIITDEWSFLTSPAYYLQNIEGKRRDIVVIDKTLLNFPWYYDQLRRRDESVIRQSQNEITGLLAGNYRFEHDLPYDPVMVEAGFTSVIQSIIKNNITRRPVYTSQGIELKYLTGFQLIPNGLFFRLYADKGKHLMVAPHVRVNIPATKDPDTDLILQNYARMNLACALYKSSEGQRDSAMFFLKEALRLRPDLEEAALVQQQIMGNPP